MKYSLLILFISFPGVAQNLIQKKYPSTAGAVSNSVTVDNTTSVLIPLNRIHDSEAFEIQGIDNGRPGSFIVKGDKNTRGFPYIIVPENEYDQFMTTQTGISGKPANHVLIQGLETLLISSSDMNTNPSRYLGIATKPAHHVSIDGQKFIFVPRAQYPNFVKQYPGVNGMPSNYILIDGKVVVVVPQNEEDTSLGGAEVNESSRHNFRELPKPAKGKAPTQKANPQ